VRLVFYTNSIDSPTTSQIMQTTTTPQASLDNVDQKTIGANACDSLQTYEKLLHTHDWYHDYSSDRRDWLNGRASITRIRELQPAVDPTWKIWNEYCPTSFAH
jgi:hypothetical protein